MDAARRRFLRGGMLTREGREAIAREEQALGPAPPWHREQLRQTVCVACDQRCKSACAADVIRIHGPNHRLAPHTLASNPAGAPSATPVQRFARWIWTAMRRFRRPLGARYCRQHHAWLGMVCCAWRVALLAQRRPYVPTSAVGHSSTPHGVRAVGPV